MKKPLLWDIVDTLYHAATDNSPAFVKDNPKTSAAVLGGVCSYLLIKGVQKACNTYTPTLYETHLPGVEKFCIGALVAGTAIYAAKHPEIASMHPVYTSGMLASEAGCIIAASEELAKR